MSINKKLNRENEDWYRLDFAGKIYPSLISRKGTTVFRLSAYLIDEVDIDILRDSAKICLEKFPYFRVNLKRGFFWHYFEHIDKEIEIEPEMGYPCMNFDIRKKGSFPFRILYFQNKISIEMSHCLTDGLGAFSFFAYLVTKYVEVRYNEKFDSSLYDKYINYSIEDAYLKNYIKNIPIPESKSTAYHFPFKTMIGEKYHLTTGEIDMKSIREQAIKYDATITEFLASAYFMAILRFIEDNGGTNKRIVLNIPVNLRKYYKSRTLNNFFFSITPEIDPRLGIYEFEEILDTMKSYMKLYNNRKKLSMNIKRIVDLITLPIFRYMPLILKDFILPISYQIGGERLYTSGFSNLGRIQFDKNVEKYIYKMEVCPNPSLGNKVKAVSVGYKNKMYITFGSVVENKSIERYFFRELRRFDIRSRITGNYLRR